MFFLIFETSLIFQAITYGFKMASDVTETRAAGLFQHKFTVKHIRLQIVWTTFSHQFISRNATII